jgi:hypothetical protein
LGLGTLELDRGNFAGAVAPLERGLELCRTREVPVRLHDFAWALGAAYHGIGRRKEGVALMEDAARGLAAERTVRWLWWAGRVGALGGAGGRRQDRPGRARGGSALGERGVESDVLRLFGDIAAHADCSEVDTAEAHDRQALALAEELGLRPLMARCHLGLGALYRRAGTRQHIRTSMTMFGEMDMRFGGSRQRRS